MESNESKPAHTPEPWEVGPSKKSVIKADGIKSKVISFMRLNDHLIRKLFEDGEPEANAARIVACVNYCKGATNEELQAQSWEQLKTQRDESVRECDVLRRELKSADKQRSNLAKQRNELLAALKELNDFVDRALGPKTILGRPIRNQATTAIANAEKGGGS